MSINPSVKLCQNPIICSLNHHISSFVLLNHHVCHIFAPFFPILFGEHQQLSMSSLFFFRGGETAQTAHPTAQTAAGLASEGLQALQQAVSDMDMAGDDIV